MPVIGIEAIVCDVPETMAANADVMEKFDISPEFLSDKLGFVSLAQKRADQETSDLSVAVAEKMFATTGLERNEIECLILVTQNPDGYGLPQTSAIVQEKLGLPSSCASFDLSLGCSGWVYGVSVATAFMESNGMKRGLLLTCDPYSKVIDPDDRDTAIIFGDGAAATLLSDTPVWIGRAFDFGTRGDKSDALIVDDERTLHMNGRAVFNFAAQEVPKSIERVMVRAEVEMDAVDEVVLHQGSKYVVDAIAKRLGCPEKVGFFAGDYGNLVSSSIPSILVDERFSKMNRIVVSGFGVGLSWATAVLEKV